MPVGGEHLVAGEDSEVHVQLFDVQGHVRRGLAGVHDHQGIGSAGQGHQFTDRIDGSEDVGGVREGQHPGTAPDDSCSLLEAEPAGIVDGQVAERRTGAERQFLPRDEVGVVLHFGDHYFVARFQGKALQCRVSAALGGP